jgi:hypothetical protein
MRLIAATTELVKPFIELDILKEGMLGYTLHGCLEVNKVVLFAIPKSEFKETDHIHSKYLKDMHIDVKCKDMLNIGFMKDFLNNTKSTNYFNITDYKDSIIILKMLGIDQDLLIQNNPNPNVLPQSHLSKSRSLTNYTAENDNYILKGSDYFYSNPVLINLSGKAVEIDDLSAFWLNQLPKSLEMEKYTDIAVLVDNKTLAYNIYSDMNIKTYRDFQYTSDWLFSITFNFIISDGKLNENDVIKYMGVLNNLNITALDNNRIHFLSYNSTTNKTDTNSFDCEIYKGNDEGIFFSSCSLIPLPYNALKNHLLGSLIYIDFGVIKKGLRLVSTVAVSDILEGRPIKSKQLVCLSTFDENDIPIYNENLLFQRRTNLLWQVENNNSQNLTLQFSNFKENYNLNGKSENLVKFNSLNVIGKKIILSTEENKKECILSEKLYFDDEIKEIIYSSRGRGGKTITPTIKELIYAIAIGGAFIIILVTIYCLCCRKTLKKSGNKTYRELEMGSGIQDF